MNAIVQQYFFPTCDFQFNSHSSKSILPLENPVSDFNQDSGLVESCTEQNGSSPVDEFSSEGESFIEKDHSDAMYKYISDMLMEEEDLEKKPCMLHDCLALQATEKSLYNVLINDLGGDTESPSDNFVKTWSTCASESSSNTLELDLNNRDHQRNFESVMYPCSEAMYSSSDLQLVLGYVNGNSDGGSRQKRFSMSKFFASDLLNVIQEVECGRSNEEVARFISDNEFLGHSSESVIDSRESVERTGVYGSSNSSNKNKSRGRGDIDTNEEQRGTKQLASNVEEVDSLEMFDKVLLCSNFDQPQCAEAGIFNEKNQKEGLKGSNRARRRGVKKQGGAKEVVDLRSLIMQCAQAVASYDTRTVNDLLMRIRQHASPHGDGNERVAHYFSNALEARLAGTGTEIYAAISSKTTSAAMILKAYQTFITACPFRKVSNILANKTIKKLAAKATRIHIIDFGILYGFQWPCLIQSLPERQEGPPMLRITGIDFPQPGFRPAERVKDTGNRLAKYCDRFNVPFEYNAIAQKWETIRVEDLKINENELLIVNSLYRFQHVADDESVAVNSPRDAVLNLIKDINPDLFIHGIVNGSYNTPFFITRFREALFHFSSMFDMFEASLPREDRERLLFEEQMFGKEIMNVIACEGTERIERPETYKQWQARNIRAGLRQIPLNQEIVKHVKHKVKRDYHKDFLVDEAGMWMIQGWKGRVIHGISCWKPANK